jgi:signal transduction histidine kinase
MNEAFETFLSLCAHPEIGGATREVRPIVVVEPGAERVVWANAAGARLCNNSTAWELVTVPSRRASTLARDLSRHVKLRGAEERTTLVRVRVGTEMLVLQCLVHGVDTGRLRDPVAFALVAAPAKFALRARDPLIAFARFVGGDNAAVVDADGTIVAGPGSDWYPRTLGTRSVALGDSGLFLRLARPPETAPAMLEPSAPIRPPLDAVHLSPCRHVAPAASGANSPPPVVEPAAPPAEPWTFRPPQHAAPADGDAPAAPEDDSAPLDAPASEPDDRRDDLEAGPDEADASPRPIRFTWQTDGDDRLTYLSPEFSTVFGSTDGILGLPWRELSTAYGLDPEGSFADALSERAAWSGTTIYWPSRRFKGRVPIDLAGLAIESRDHVFSGFRGFGLIRAGDTVFDEPDAPAPEAAAASHLSLVRKTGSVADAAPFRADPRTNIVRLPNREPDRTDNRHLSRPERDAFRMIAAALGARFEGDDDEPAPFAEAGEPTPLAPEPTAARVESRAAPRRRHADPEPAAMPSAFAGAGQEPDTRILDRLPLALIVSRNERLAHVNTAALTLLGYRSREALERAGGLTAVFADVVDGPAGSENTIHLSHADGRILPAEVRLHTVPWGDGRALLIILRAEPAGKSAREDRAMSDETDAGDDRTPGNDGRAAFDAQAEDAPRLSGVLDAIPDAVFVLDPDRRIVLANSGAEAIFGRPAPAFKGMLLEHLFSENDAGATRELFAELGAGRDAQQPLVIDEVIGLCRERGQVPLALSLGRVGNGPRACAVLRDVGRWKSAEARFSEATRAAETANAQKSEMLARISHEIRTPLNAILGFADVMLAEKLGPIGNERYRDYLRDISISGHHILSLVNDLLDLSKIEAGKLDLSFEPVSANDIARDCANIMEPQAHTDRVAIRTRLQADLPRILADSRALRQITLNLLSNAIKFNRSGGEVSLATFRDESGAVVLRVSDTGVGMSSDDLQAAMEPFRRVGSTDKSGTGLGLPLTKALAEANRADFAIRSEPGGGTVVDIIFPAPRVLAA